MGRRDSRGQPTRPNARQSGLGLEGRGEVRSDVTSRKVNRGRRSGKAGLERRGVAAGRPRAGRERRAPEAVWGDGRQECNQGGLHGGAALPALHLMGLGHYCPQRGCLGGRDRSGERCPEALESGGVGRGSGNRVPWSPHLQHTSFNALEVRISKLQPHRTLVSAGPSTVSLKSEVRGEPGRELLSAWEQAPGTAG